MVLLKISLTSFNLSINARGATVPFSEGWAEMWKKRERSAENKVGGDGGMGGPVGGAEPLDGVASVVEPDVDGLRSGFFLTGVSDD